MVPSYGVSILPKSKKGAAAHGGVRHQVQRLPMSVSRYTRLVFGIKLKELRLQLGYSFAELSARSGMSVSYLNEIENGKKYPKPEKAEDLAAALGTTVRELASLDLPKTLQPLADFLHSGILDELPLELFGIDISRVVEIIANAPLKVSAFVSALTDISRKYEMQEENFHFAALRSYQRLFDNYFDDIEQEAERFRTEHGMGLSEHMTLERLYESLRKDFRYRIDKATLSLYPELRGIRSVALPEKKKLLVSSLLDPTQERFLLAKEIGYRYLKLKERVYTSNMLQVNSFEEALNNFKTSYFAGALLLPREPMLADLRALFLQPTWHSADFEAMVQRYQASPEMFFQRLTNLLPKYFGMQELFLLRFSHHPETDDFELTKELHLGRQHQPHANETHEHYCRRWITIWLLQDLAGLPQHEPRGGKILTGIQRSRYLGSNDEYLVFTMARSGYPTPNTNVSVGLGIAVTDANKALIRFLQDPKIPVRGVHQTCERCPANDCRERVAPPTVLEEKRRKKRMQEVLRDLMG